MKRRQFLTRSGTAVTLRGTTIALSGASMTLSGCTAPRGGSTEDDDDPASTLVASWRSRDPTSRMTLQWVTDTPAQDAHQVRLTAENGPARTTTTTISTFGETEYHRYRAVFTELQPDTRYSISIDGSETGFTVRTAPTVVSEPLTFAEGGDVGTSGAVPRLHRQARDWDPLFGLVGGDLAYANANPANVDRWLTFLQHWHEHMQTQGRLIPLVAAIGNHEVAGGMHGTPADAPFYYDLFDNTQREHAYWAMDFGDDLSILILDSNHSTPVPGAQTDWLEKALATRRSRTHLLVAYHVPAYPSAKPIAGAGRDRIDIRKHWVPLFEEYDIDIAFEHDDHTYKRTYLLRDGKRDPEKGILYVGDGAWGKGPRQAKDRDYLRVSKRSLNVIRTQLFPDGSRRLRAVDAGGTVIDEYETNDGAD